VTPTLVVRRRSEAGSVLVEVVWLSLLLLVPLVYLLISVFDVQRSSYGLSGAARAAARAYSLSPDEGSASNRARDAAAVALRDHDIAIDDVALRVRCAPTPSNCLAPGSLISVDLRQQVRLPLMPSALGNDAPTFRVEASHTVAYGTFREDR
jgi:hypothetical protein